MKKSGLLILFFVNIFFATAQEATKDTTEYKKRVLNDVEVEFITGYYYQDGNNSAVTGGIGTEKLDVVTPSIVVTVPFVKDSVESTFTVDGGFDAYSSASSDNINPNTLSSASSGDVRSHANLSYSRNNTKTRNTWGVLGSTSVEFDYTSIGVGLSYAKTSKDLNKEFGVSAKSYFDSWSVIKPYELRYSGATNTEDVLGGANTMPRNSHSLSLYYSGVINRKMQFVLMSDVVYQEGLLSTPFHRVYFSDISSTYVEKLPDTRFKIPIGLRINSFISDFLILRTYYRYYQDDWDIEAHTFNIETPVKISPFFSLYPYYRYYTQGKAKYFAPYQKHVSSEDYFTSDYDLSDFNSSLIGIGLRYSSVNGLLRFKNPILGKRKLQALELRAGHYSQTTGLKGNVFSIYLKFTH